MKNGSGLPNASEVVRGITAKFHEEGGGAGAPDDGGNADGADNGAGGGLPEDSADGGAGSGADAGAGGSQPGAKDQGDGGSDDGGKNKPGDQRSVPLSELQKERKRRQELEARVEEYEKTIKPDYEKLKEFDRHLGAFLTANPKEHERLKNLMAGKAAEAEATQDAIEDQLKEFGDADPRLLKLFQQQTQSLKALEKRLNDREASEKTTIEMQRQLRHYETEISELEKKYPGLKTDKELMEDIIDLAEAKNSDSLIPIAEKIMAREAARKKSWELSLVKKGEKREGAKVEGPGAAGGVKSELKPVGDDERAKQIQSHYAARG